MVQNQSSLNLAPVAPAIDTQRLTLRGHQLSDFDECAAMWADPRVTRHIGGVPSTTEEAWARVLRYVGHWSLLGFGYWVIREKATGQFVGETGFADFKRKIVPPLAPEIGWALAVSAHNKGFATEAVRAAVAWGVTHFGAAGRTVCLISPTNVASLRVAEKCGYKEYQRTTYKGEPTLVLESQPAETG